MNLGNSLRTGKWSVVVTAAASVLATLCLSACGRSGPDLSISDAGISLLSFNIRYNNPRDGINAWPNRKTMAAEVFERYSIDLAGLQEALLGQILDLETALPAFAWIGVGREDGIEKGEFSPIFYRTRTFELLDEGAFWLSETPSVPGSVSWDSSLTRIATYGIFRRKADGFSLFFLNTHFDHVGKTAREKSARLVVDKLKTLARGLPVVVTGDFNTEESSEPVITLLSDPSIGLNNSGHLSLEPHFGGDTSFNGFGRAESPRIIDFIFVDPTFRVLQHGFLTDRKDGVYISDHYPVFSRLKVAD